MAQITFTLLLLTAKAHASLRCIELFEEDITAKITNARQSVESYNQPNGRTLTAIGNSLGAEAIAAIENLKKGALVIDSGSGFSIAGIELALKGIRVIAINAQNAWEFFANQVNSEAFSPKFKRIISLAIDELKITIEGTRLKKKFNGTSYYYDIDAASAKDLKILGQRLLQKLNSLHQKGLFNYFVGFSDLLLRHTSQEADLLLDHWGALFYSPNRTLLLDAYYSNLKIGGIAFMRIKGAEGEGVNDTVTIGRGRASYQMSLVDYLVQKYPNNFEKLNGGRTLKMIRTKDVENLGLQELLKAVTQTVERFDGGEYPGVVWQLN